MAKLLHTQYHDGGRFRDQWFEEDGKIYRVRTQRDAELIKAQNQAIASDPTNLRAADGLRWALRIPIEDHVELIRKYPELASKDRDIKHRASRKFIASDEAIPYLVARPSKRGRSL